MNWGLVSCLMPALTVNLQGAMRTLRQWLVLLFGVAFLNANALGAHLHLCFDGKEPPRSVHVFDGSQGLHHVGATQKHNDIDVKVTDQALAKVIKVTPTSSSPALPPSWNVLEPPLVEAISSVSDRTETASESVRRLLPPQRGPPV